MVAPASGETAWLPGVTVGGAYRIVEQIGEGGFGGVFRCERLSDQRLVALKLLSREAMGRDGAVPRFKREADLAMRLKHESTIRVLDSGDAGDGTPFIAFELLEGTSLDRLLQAGPLTPGQAVTVARAVLGSLAEAHRAGIVHRDVKPANVYVCSRPDGLVKLLDFGVAKSTTPTTEAGLTADGLMVGTPAYMAPEQISGTELYPQTDLYAVALVLGEMLSGKPMYDSAAIAICMDKLRGVLPPVDPRIATSPLFRAIEKALATEHQRRPASAEQMLQLIESCGVAAEPLWGLTSGRPSGSKVSAKGTEIIEAPAGSRSAQKAPSGPSEFPQDFAYAATLGVPTPQRFVAPSPSSQPQLPAPPSHTQSDVPSSHARYWIIGVVALFVIVIIAVLVLRGDKPRRRVDQGDPSNAGQLALQVPPQVAPSSQAAYACAPPISSSHPERMHAS